MFKNYRKKRGAKTIKYLTFLFAVSLGFDRLSNVYFFYTLFFLFSLVSIYLYIKSPYKFKFPFLIKGYFIFAVFAGLSVFWAVSQQLAIEMFIRLLLVSYCMVLVYMTNKKYGTTIYFVKGLIFLVIINFVLLISPISSSLYTEMEGALRYSGTFKNANALAILVIFAIYFYSKLFRLKVFKRVYLLILFAIFAEILIFSTGSRKGLVFGNILLLITIYNSVPKNKKVYYALFFAFLSSILLLSFPQIWESIQQKESFLRISSFLEYFESGDGDGSTRWRFYFMEEAFRIFKENTLIGVGIDNFQTFTGEGLYAHNNYLEILADLGIIGFVIIYSIYFRLFLFLKRKQAFLIDYSLFFIVLAMEMFFVSYYSRPFWISLVFMCSIISSTKQIKSITS